METLVDFIDDEFRFRIHDSQMVLAAGEVIVGEWLGIIQTVNTPQIVRAGKELQRSRSEQQLLR